MSAMHGNAGASVSSRTGGPAIVRLGSVAPAVEEPRLQTAPRRFLPSLSMNGGHLQGKSRRDHGGFARTGIPR